MSPRKLQQNVKQQQRKLQQKQSQQKLSSVFEIADLYDYFIIDVWGVLHNGMSTFPFVKETLTKLRSMGKDIILLTNSPRSSDIIEKNLEAFGILKDVMYSAIVTSGDLSKVYISNFIKSGKDNCYFIGSRMQHSHLIDVDGLFVVDSIDCTDFILLSGPDDDMHGNVLAYSDVLSKAACLSLPLLCANPDVNVMVGEEEVACAGTIALMYKEKGGEVIYSGKPFSPIYEMVYKALGHDKKPENKKGICIGDSMNTDIKGAKGQGLDSMLVCSGINNEHGDDSEFLSTYIIDELK